MTGVQTCALPICPSIDEWSALGLLLPHEGARRTCAQALPVVATATPSLPLAWWLNAHLTGPMLAYGAAMRTHYYTWAIEIAQSDESGVLRRAAEELLPAAERALQSVDAAAAAAARRPSDADAQRALRTAVDAACGVDLPAYMDFAERSVAPIVAKRAVARSELAKQQRVFRAVGRAACKSMLPTIGAAVDERGSGEAGATSRAAHERLRATFPVYSRALHRAGIYAEYDRLNNAALLATIGGEPSALDAGLAPYVTMYSLRFVEEILAGPTIVLMTLATFVLCHCTCHAGSKSKRS